MPTLATFVALLIERMLKFHREITLVNQSIRVVKGILMDSNLKIFGHRFIDFETQVYFRLIPEKAFEFFLSRQTRGKSDEMEDKMKLYGFNNLTKSLSFNIYDVCYAKSPREQKDYVAYIDEQYNSDRLTDVLYKVTEMIGANVLNVSKQDYEPQGASVTFLIAEESMIPCGDTVVAHLDKSHVTVHTYPEYHPDTSIATFRVDIDVATCGEITPLSTLDFLIGSFDSDIITMDYRVRGFTRDISGRKLFMDHKMTSIQDYIDEKTLEHYDAIDINVYQSNIYHTKMLIKEIDLQNYLFNTDVYEIPPKTRLNIMNNLHSEMIEIFSGKNIY